MADWLKKLLSFFAGCSPFAMVLPSDFYSHDFLLLITYRQLSKAASN